MAVLVRDDIADRDKVVRGAWLVFAVIVFCLVLAIRIRLLGIPLERDEGEYAYAGQLMLQGIPPYKLAYNMKFPGTYAAYAGIMLIFGQTIAGIHLGLLLVNAATIAVIFLLGRRLMSTSAGFAAAASYAVLSVSPSVLGLAAHATHFVVLPVLGGTILLRNLSETDRLASGELFASGLLFGIGLLMKQPAFFFIPFGVVYLLFADIRRGRGLKQILLRNLIFGTAVVLPFAITCLLLWHAGVFDKFWFWTIRYAQQYGSLIPLKEAPNVFAGKLAQVMGAGWALWVLAGVGLVAGLSNMRSRTSTGILFGLLAASTLALSSGFYFRLHYFILVLPPVALLAGLAVAQLSDRFAGSTMLVRLVPLLLIGGAISLPILSGKNYLFEASPFEACRMNYRENPFPESLRIAQYLSDHTSPSDTIAVLGSEPQIYFYSSRHSATGYIYTYSLMEPQSYAGEMQREMIREIELAKPKYLISVEISASWLRRRESQTLILDWANQYIESYYEAVGLVNIVTPERSDYYLGQLPKPMPRCDNCVLIYQRKA